MSETKKHEECSFCGEYTGRAGKGDDSIYINGIGPYCELCADEIMSTARGIRRLGMTESDKQTVEEIKEFYKKWLFDSAQLNEEPDYEIRALGKMLDLVDSQALEIAEARSSAAQYRDAGFNFDGYGTFEAQQQAKQEYIKAHPLPWEQEAK